MKTIVLAMRKGGTGKTTNTRNIAVALHKRGYKVLLVDTDTQGSLTAWWTVRKGGMPELVVIPSNVLKEGLQRIASEGYDYVLIDTPPESNEVITNTVAVADFVLVPLKAGADDLRAVGQTIKLVKQLEIPFAFVMNEIDPRANISREIAEAVSQFGPLAPSQVRRVEHVETAVDGLTCLDSSRSSKATKDVNALTDYILQRLENLS